MIAVCPLGCRPALQRTAIVLPEGPLRRCPECGLLVSSCTDEQYASALARWDTETGTRPGHDSLARFRQTAQRRLARAIRLLGSGPTPRLLDVGCSSGSLLAVAREMGFSAAGVETAPAAAASARQAGFEVFSGRLQDAHYDSDGFDVITLIELIEHVADPLELLHSCRQLLRPGGVALINTPNAASWTARVLHGRWEGFSLTRLGGHICFYSPATIRVLAARTGFNVESISTRHVRLSEPGSEARATYRLLKLVAEMLAMPARWAGAGHDLLALLKRGD